MTTTYTTIDLHSGYVWWSGEATDPADACRLSTLETGGDEITYREAWSREAADRGGYAVYETALPADADGQRRDVIDAVEASPLAGYYVRA